MKLSIVVILTGLAVLMCIPTASHADPITVTETTTGSGSLDGTNFFNEFVTLTLTGDTANVTNPVSGFYKLIGPVTVDVNNIGSDTLSPAVYAFVQQATSAAGMSSGPGDILNIPNAGFSSYDLTTSIGPLSGPGIINSLIPFSTVGGGTFYLESLAEPATFTATVTTPVPEPDSLLLLGVGLLGLALLASHKRKPVCSSSITA